MQQYRCFLPYTRFATNTKKDRIFYPNLPFVYVTMAYLNTAPYVTAGNLEKWFKLFLCNRYCAYNFLWVILFQIILHFWKKYIFGGNIGLFAILL